MNDYQYVWFVCGYADRRAKVLATKATDSRKWSALNKLYERMNNQRIKRISDFEVWLEERASKLRRDVAVLFAN